MEDSRIIELYESRDQQAISQSNIKYGGYCYSVGYNILGVREDTEECGSGHGTPFRHRNPECCRHFSGG
jgi:hypothetical protein